ncbi:MULTISPECIES: hypothetical protein [Salinibaculum]
MIFARSHPTESDGLEATTVHLALAALSLLACRHRGRLFECLAGRP